MLTICFTIILQNKYNMSLDTNAMNTGYIK